MERALVLGGGGVAGIAWEAGLITGLRRRGIDLGAADVFVGTSAGSVVGAFLAHEADGVGDIEATIDVIAGEDAEPSGPGPDMGKVLESFLLVFDRNVEPVEARRRVGEFARTADTGVSGARLELIHRHLPSESWPARRLLVTAVDAEDGTLRVWESGGAADFADAVVSSCSVPGVFPVREIDGRVYMDGGVRSGTNADLASGADVVVVLEPLSYLTPRHMLEEEVAELGSAKVEAVGPNQAAIDLFGFDFLDPALWRSAFEVGLAQAEEEAPRLTALWNG